MKDERQMDKGQGVLILYLNQEARIENQESGIKKLESRGKTKDEGQRMKDWGY
jgi:hypothetical protein